MTLLRTVEEFLAIVCVSAELGRGGVPRRKNMIVDVLVRQQHERPRLDSVSDGGRVFRKLSGLLQSHNDGLAEALRFELAEERVDEGLNRGVKPRLRTETQECL